MQKFLTIFQIRGVDTNTDIVAGDLDFWPTLQIETIETVVPGDCGVAKG